MKRPISPFFASSILSFTLQVRLLAATHYVDLNSTNPQAPYTNWATASRVIQLAVDVAAAGDEVVVTNGVYATGGRAVYGPMTNRVALTKALTVRSVNGPQFTSIQGWQVPGTGYGQGAVRCAYLTNGATLSGFTLARGATRTYGFEREEYGGGVWCASTTAVVSNCVLAGNTAYTGAGGAYGGTLNNCTLTGNSASSGGGAYGSTLNNCTLTWNLARGDSGGGAASGTLNNCALSGNSAYYYGGGASGTTLNNCTLTGNSAQFGGGADSSALNNCIIYFNSASLAANSDRSTLNYCCTTPLPATGVGNVSADPQLADATYLLAGSPCRGAGNAAYTSGTDIDGQAWVNPPSIGCAEYRPSPITGPLSVAITVASTTVSANYPVTLAALIAGQSTGNLWDFGDGRLATNQIYPTHTWTSPGTYVVLLSVYNDSQPVGVNATLTVHVVAQPVHYVAAHNLNPVAPYTNWATAATNLQDAVDTFGPTPLPGSLVLVTNGTYATGGRVVYGTLTNRVAVTLPLILRSVNGPQFTVIQGSPSLNSQNGNGAVRCVYLSSGATLSGFTLTNGATLPSASDYHLGSGGGLWCESQAAVVTNCVVVGNWAAYSGGGAHGGTLNKCLLAGNRAGTQGGSGALGGGTDRATLNSCTLTNNSANCGGGANGSALNDCLLSGNSALFEGSYGGSGGGAFDSTLIHCILTGNSAVPQGTSGGTGGAAYRSTLINCTLTGNTAFLGNGGGAFQCTLNNCALSRNSASSAGGASGSTLNNCTVTGNSAAANGGGVVNSSLNNCVDYFNSSPQGVNYDSGSTFNYCCTTPRPVAGNGNFTANPQLTDARHLSSASPCRGTGSPAFTTGTDTDGESWANPPSIGCDEYRSGALTGPLAVSVTASLTNVLVGYPTALTAFIDGRPTSSVWDFSDGVLATNLPLATHAWAAPGDYPVILTAYNDSQPSGVSATLTIHVGAVPVHYVAADSTNPVPPYTSWATAATNIQDAVDAYDATTLPGALVLVTNGIYATGGRAVYGTMTNRVTVDKPLALRSVNGPQSTVIQGYPVPGTTNGDGAVRCVYLTNGASLSGFTLTNGATRSSDSNLESTGGGVFCASLTAVISNCVLTGNSAAYTGGGAAWGTLVNCTLTGNSAWYGGGAGFCELSNCTLSGNSSQTGAGAVWSTLVNCTVSGNSAFTGGGVAWCTLDNCALTGNSAVGDGGASWNSTFNNCTLVGNSSTYYVGGAAGYGTLNNCIVYFNTSPNQANYDGAPTLNYCCTTPQPTSGVGNISVDPQLASASHLSAGSPCRGAGSAQYWSGTDIDGESWADPPSIGCDEYHAGVVARPLSASIAATYTNVALGFPVGLTALIEGRATASIWDFGDGTRATNQPVVSHAWTAPGNYQVVLWAYSESQSQGVSATLLISVDRGIHYVAAISVNPTTPYDSWATAATNIQDAVDSAGPGGIVVVTNGTYSTGEQAVYAARVVVTKPLLLQSVNGPELTVIEGYQVPGTTNGDGAIRCVYMTDGTTLSGFTLTNGATRNVDSGFDGYGGGVFCASRTAVVTNCVLTGNSALHGGGAIWGTLNNCTLVGNSVHGDGAGASDCTLNHCILSGNRADEDGGGAAWCTLNDCRLTGNSAYRNAGGAAGGRLNNCVLSANSASYGGGAADATLNNCTLVGNAASSSGGGAYSFPDQLCTMNNCIVYYNAAPDAPNYNGFLILTACCTTPLPNNGSGNITLAPLFVDLAGGDLRSQSNSPCINAGNNSYVTNSTDLDGNPRIVGGTVDMGAYEFQTPASTISYAWLQYFGLPTDSSADSADPDGDGLNNWQEWRSGTNPTNALSALQMLAAAPTGTNVKVTWQSVAGLTYFLERSTDLGAQPAFTVLQSNITGQLGTTIYTDTNAVGSGPFFYRVGVGN